MTIKLTTNKGYATLPYRSTYKIVVTKINKRLIEGNFQLWNRARLRYKPPAGLGIWYWDDIHNIEILSP